MPTKVKICLSLMHKAISEPLGARYSSFRPGSIDTIKNMRSTCYHLRAAAQELGEHKFDGLKFSIRSEDGGVSLYVTSTLPEDGTVESILKSSTHKTAVA